MCANLWTELISIREWRKTSNKGLNLRPEDLIIYNSPLVSFDGKVIIPRDQIRLLVQTGLEVVDAYFPCTAIVARPWLHTLGAFSSTMHQKVKYSSKGQVREILGSQSTARQCMAAAMLHQPEIESSTSIERGI